MLGFDFELSLSFFQRERIYSCCYNDEIEGANHSFPGVLTMNDLIQLLPWQHIARKLGKPCGIVFVRVTPLGENTKARTHFFIVFSNDSCGCFSGYHSLSNYLG